MKKRILVIVTGLLLCFGITAGIAVAVSAQTATQTSAYCVTFGHGSTAAGNLVEFNWDHSQCPAGTYAHDIAMPVDSDPYLPPTLYANQQPTDPANTATSAIMFRITDQNVHPNVTYDCGYSVDEKANTVTLHCTVAP